MVVVPLVGTWIETCCLEEYKSICKVVPLVGTWIETPWMSNTIIFAPSFPSWERGLKPLQSLQSSSCGQSFPSWERGLKLVLLLILYVMLPVVPLVGTWIETAPIDPAVSGL